MLSPLVLLLVMNDEHFDFFCVVLVMFMVMKVLKRGQIQCQMNENLLTLSPL